MARYASCSCFNKATVKSEFCARLNYFGNVLYEYELFGESKTWTRLTSLAVFVKTKTLESLSALLNYFGNHTTFIYLESKIWLLGLLCYL